MKLILFFSLCSIASAQNVVSVISTGAVPDLQHGFQNRQAFFTAFLQAGQGGTVVVPPGTYAIDNSAGPLFIQFFNGDFVFEGGATIVFTDNTHEGLRCDQWRYSRIIGLHSTYANPSAGNTGNYEVIFTAAQTISLENVTVENASSVALQLQGSNLKAHNLSIRNAAGGGLQVTNSRFVQIDNVTTDNTGDDGIAFLLYNPGSNSDSTENVVATNLSVHTSGGNGIKVAGPSEVVIDGFLVDGTTSSGVICLTDAASRTGVSFHVLFNHGVVQNIGAVPLPGGRQHGNMFGIEFENPGSCSFDNIKVVASQTAAVSVKGVAGAAPTGEINLSNIHVIGGYPDSVADGFNVSANVLTITNCISENVPAAGFYFSGPGTLIANNLTAINVSQANTARNAFWFSGTGFSTVSDLKVIDTQPTPTGFVVGGSAGTGVIDGVLTHLSNGMNATYVFPPNTFDVHNAYSK